MGRKVRCHSGKCPFRTGVAHLRYSVAVTCDFPRAAQTDKNDEIKGNAEKVFHTIRRGHVTSGTDVHTQVVRSLTNVDEILMKTKKMGVLV